MCNDPSPPSDNVVPLRELCACIEMATCSQSLPVAVSLLSSLSPKDKLKTRVCRGTHSQTHRSDWSLCTSCCCEGKNPEKKTFLFYLHFMASSVRFLRLCGFGVPARAHGLSLALSQRLSSISREAGLLAPSPLILVCRGQSSFACAGRSRRARSRVPLGFSAAAAAPRPVLAAPVSEQAPAWIRTFVSL